MVNSSIGKILVVDDEVELRNILIEALTSRGYETSGFTSGKEALAALRGEAFDVLLTDLMMPGMDGITLVREGLKIDPHLVCMMMTGQGTIQTAVDAMKEGAFDYVLKPFRLQTVLPVLTRAMNTRHMRLENLQLRETVAIYELGQTIAFTLDPQTVISKLADAALQQTDADEVSILLPTGEGANELYVAAVRGENRERLLGERVPFDQSISGWVARNREPLVLDGEINDKRFRSLCPHPEIRSAISIPMQVAGKLVGTINVNALSRPRPFTLGQMKALTILAGTAAAALETASLYKQVQQAEQNYRSIFENAVEGIFQSTAEGRFITMNPAMADIFGYGSPEAAIEGITDIARQIYVDPRSRSESERIQEERGILQGFEFEAYRKDGKKIWLSLNRRSIRDHDGIEIYREGSVEDITARKRTEEALKASESRKDAILKTALDCVITIDHEGVVIDFNPAAEHTFGYAREDIVGKKMADLIVPPSMRPEHEHGFARYLATGCSAMLGKRIEVTAMLADGNEIPVELTITAIGELPHPTFTAFIRDLTERKRAEDEQARLNAEIKQQTDRLNTIVATVPGVVFEVSGRPGAPDNRTNFVSEYIGPMLGYTVSEWMAVPGFWLSIVHPDDRQRVAKAAVADFAEGRNGGHEFRWMRKDGRIVWVRAHTIVVRNEDGQPIGVRGVVTDITERKHSEDTLRETLRSKAESLALLDTILSCAPVGFAFHNRDLVYERINDTLAAINGLPAEKHLGRKVHDVVPQLAPVLEPYLKQVLKTGAPVIDFELGGESPTDPGRQRYWLVSFYPVRMQGGEMLGVGVLVSDITERKRAEEELSKSEERYRDLVENAHDIIYSHDLQGNYTSINRAGEQITGYTREESLALNLAATVAPEDLAKTQEMLRRKVAGEKVTAYDMVIIAKDGHRVAVEANTKLVYQDGVPIGVQGIARDVTERKLLEEQLRQSQKMEAIGQLAGGVAHDFNNLLTAINGYSSLALQRLEPDHPIKPYLEEVKKAGDRATNLTRQLLAFGRKQILQPVALNLNDAVSDMNKMLRRLIGEDIHLTAKLDLDLGKVMADPGQMEQVLVNLIVNARDAMPQGGTLTIETSNAEFDSEYLDGHVGAHPGNYVMLAVSDTGTGMDAQTRQHIFEPFFTTKEKGKGTGLGLSTVFGIVKQSGGNIWVYSEPGKGTTFKVYLLRVEPKGAQPKEHVADTAPLGGSETVLLVEDEEVVRSLARRILEQAGYSVMEAGKAAEALRFFEEHVGKIDLLLTDVVMPEMSGKELADRLKAKCPELKMLFMSGYTDEAIVHHGVLDSSVEFIQKPFTPAGLIKKVRDVLDLDGKGTNGRGLGV